MTGRYAAQGAEVAVGLRLFARQTGARLQLLDDRSRPERAARLHAELREAGCRLVLGPYGSDSTRAVVAASGGAVVWNHGGAADDVQRARGVVSLPSPASRYLVALARAVGSLRPGARVAVLTGPGRFAHLARQALEEETGRIGVELVADPGRAQAVLLCGPVGWEVERFRRLRRRGLLLGGVSPGLASFPRLLGGDPEGLLAPVQWHPDLRFPVDLGPDRVALEDYVAAQAYAAALVAAHCLELSPEDPLSAARELRATTFFGPFRLAPDGLQVGHQLSVVQWRRGRRELKGGQVLH